MTKQEALQTIKLLSALESWSFSSGQRLPDYLHDGLQEVIEVAESILLKETDRILYSSISEE